MSTHTERSAWSPEEVDSLENIDKEIQLVSTSTESASNPSHGNRSADNDKLAAGRQSHSKLFHSKSSDNINTTKLHLSCDDLFSWGKNNNNNHAAKNKNGINRSNTFVNYKSNKKTNKYDQVQSKIKLNYNNSTKVKGTPAKIPVIAESTNKEDYLEQVNKQLIQELDEKNAILSLLQENYEHLLFKYAEAQNRIDELRFKFLSGPTDTKTFPTNPRYFNDYPTKSDAKCQKAVVTPFIKLDEANSPVNEEQNVTRPSSLPLDNGLKFSERDLLKATTPTDSEGLSSIITSMSGHSKIINSLDEENQMQKKSNYKYQRNNFVLEETSALNDSFDKVKNWQNSLPPLEQIETPETTLYNISNNYSSGNKLQKIEKSFISDESCPASWREESQRCRNGIYDSYRSKPQYNNETERFHEGFEHKNKTPPEQKRRKKPPLLRCASLPAYDADSGRSGKYKNGIYIPPLDLANVTLSDDESYCQQPDHYVNNVVTSSSFVTSSIDRSIQTPQSFSSCKATISEERVPRQTISKSTSITPDRSRVMELLSRRSDKANDWCNICGESISESNRIYWNKSCESVHSVDAANKDTPVRRPKPPFTRSVSFGSETNTPKYCSHEKPTSRGCISGLSQESIDDFDVYANNLKARSQVVIKALAAHVNNS